MIIKKILCSLLIFASIFALPPIWESSMVETVGASIESELAEKKNQLKELEAALAESKAEKNRILESINKSKDKLNALLVKKNQLEASIQFSENEITIIENLVLGYEEHLSSLEVSLNKAEKLKEEKVFQLCSVLKYIYENKDVSTLELFFSSENFSEYISRKEYAETILEYQKTIIEEIESVTAETEQSKNDYEKAKASLDGYKATLEANRTSIDSEYAALDSIVSSIEGEIELSENEYNAIDEIEKEYANEISRVEIDIEDLTDYLSNRYIWPFASNQSYYISSPFGYRYGPFSGYEHHNGVDIVVPHGTPILASSGGVVTRSEYAAVFGNVVVITHSNGLQTLYCHCSKRLVSVGDRVKQGEKIALVGSTGNSTGAHLHFAFILNGKYVNPNKYVDKSYFR